eukprot:COSAG02_NODE_41740_length_391_cov_1.068493_1_plen_54_part_10
MYLHETPKDFALVSADLDLPVAAVQLRRLQAMVDRCHHAGSSLYGPSVALDVAI